MTERRKVGNHGGGEQAEERVKKGKLTGPDEALDKGKGKEDLSSERELPEKLDFWLVQVNGVGTIFVGEQQKKTRFEGDNQSDMG